MTGTDGPPPRHHLVRVGRTILAAVVIAWTLLAVGEPIRLLAAVSYGAVGTLLAIRRPRNPIGWLVLLEGLVLAKPDLVMPGDVAAVAAGTAAPATAFVVWLEAWTGGVGYAAFLALAILFPTGQLPVGRWRRPALIILAMAFAPTITVAETSLANPYAFLPSLPLWGVVPGDGLLFFPLLGLVATGVVSLLVRYRNATGVLRQQLRWLVTSVLFVFAALAFGIAAVAITGTVDSVAWLPAIVAYPMVPIAIGIAVFRYRLFEIDRIVSRTIAYAIVSAIVAVTFSGAILLLSTVLAPFTQGQTIAVAASTLAAFAVFQPVLHRVRRDVDRRFNRAHYDGESTAAAFAERLRDEVDLSTLSNELDATVRRAVAPTSFGLWIRTGER